MESAELKEDLDAHAAAFSRSLQDLAVFVDGEISKVMRKAVLDVYRHITKASPVDTGAYRASHGIANLEPADTDGIVLSKDKKKVPFVNKGKTWSWYVGDGDIWLYNNVPYAERIEDGWSKKAPEGVYRVALAVFTVSFDMEVGKMKTLVPDSGE
jgi:hypothetical protein